ncbi:MAG: hypothetical protein GQ523_04225 [Methanophagales archaeon]|nr:hypothetical protein [Methanophagales archaeon]
MEVEGFVENLKHYDVRIIAEGEDANIDRFIERIEIRKFPMDVESIEVSFEMYEGEFQYFVIKRGDWHEELLERLDTAGTLLYKSVELGERSVALGEESVGIGEKMLGKQDKTIDAIDRSKEEMVTEISSLSQPFSF